MTAIDLATLTVKPLLIETWSAYAALIERHNGVRGDHQGGVSAFEAGDVASRLLPQRTNW